MESVVIFRSFITTRRMIVEASNKLCCLLTSPELQKRKTDVLQKLQGKILERKEDTDGYAFRFDGDDESLDQLVEFIKTERACCPFFNFYLSVGGDKPMAWLRLSGPMGVKEFIRDELGFLDP